jgi:hypothetical protein
MRDDHTDAGHQSLTHADRPAAADRKPDTDRRPDSGARRELPAEHLADTDHVADRAGRNNQSDPRLSDY